MKRLLVVLMITIFATLVVHAEDDQGNVNDPGENDRANACYEDGSMAGKCETDWEWECGWYFIRFEYGSLSRDNFPGWCASLLPAIVEDDASALLPGAGCTAYLGEYIFFGSGNFLPAGTAQFSDASCTTPSGNNTLIAVVYSTTGTPGATAICVSNGFTGSGLIGGNVYHCS